MPPESPSLSSLEILDSLGLAVIATDPAGVVLYWNPAAERLYGWTPAEAVGRQINNLTVPEISQEAGAEIMQALRGGVPWTGGFPVHGKTGRAFLALVTDTAIHRGSTIVGVVGVTTSLGSTLQPLLERLTGAALLLDEHGVVSYASPAVVDLFDWHDIAGMSVTSLVAPDDADTLLGLVEQAITDPVPQPTFELRVRTPGGLVWADMMLTSLMGDPDARGVVCSLRPSPRRAALENAERVAAQLQTALETRVVIEQAKGYLAGTHGVDLPLAFEALRSYARSHHLNVHEVAEQVVGGQLELAPQRPARPSAPRSRRQD